MQIDIAPTRIGLRYPADVGLVGDCRTVLRRCCRCSSARRTERSLEKAQERMKQLEPS